MKDLIKKILREGYVNGLFVPEVGDNIKVINEGDEEDFLKYLGPEAGNLRRGRYGRYITGKVYRTYDMSHGKGFYLEEKNTGDSIPFPYYTTQKMLNTKLPHPKAKAPLYNNLNLKYEPVVETKEKALDDLDWIRDVSGKQLKPYELMNELKKVFPEIEMEMATDQVTTGGYAIEGHLMITTHKEINPTNQEWFNRIEGVEIKFSDDEDVDKVRFPYLIGDWYEQYHAGRLNDADADWNVYGDLNDVIEYIKEHVGPNGKPHISYGEDDW